MGESLEEAVIREVFEECSITVSDCHYFQKFEFIQKDDTHKIKYHYIVLDYICNKWSGQVKAGGDVDDVCWFEQKDLSKIRTTKGTIDLIHKAFLLQ